ncbi:CHRNA7-FAM7A fusion protein-like [Mercenaria mercenaria]|uniref:CHRNA7-FAM7A fusion protein-like n=1 Tax=Mercenaria mercenaria TaxID=6596 RepID=UPI00234FA28C|nr:CHRNA7-FAM7A fusion protein-like [Mercenaria mercenaria]
MTNVHRPTTRRFIAATDKGLRFHPQGFANLPKLFRVFVSCKHEMAEINPIGFPDKYTCIYVYHSKVFPTNTSGFLMLRFITGNASSPLQTLLDSFIVDLLHFFSAENALGGIEDYRASVYPDGSVYYYFPSVVATLCKMDVTYFPFDTQTCPIKLGSWSYFGNELNLTGRDGETAADIATYKENGEWEIVGAPAVRHVNYFSCCPDPFPDVTFYVTLKRRPRFYLLNLMFPCILMSSMAVLAFLLPPDSGEKVSLEITVLLSLSVFMLVVSETMPPTSETFPYIGMYFTCAMLLVSWSCLMTVTVLNLHHRGGNGRRMPSWVRTVFLKWLGGILFQQGKEHKSKLFCKQNKVNASDIFSDKMELTDMESNLSGDDVKLCNLFVSPTIPRRHSSTKDNRKKSMIAEEELCEHFSSPNVPKGFVANFRKSPITAGDERSEEIRLMKLQLECIESIHDYLNSQKQCDEVAEEWQQLARVIDRVVMILFFTFQLIATVIMMVKIMSEH